MLDSPVQKQHVADHASRHNFVGTCLPLVHCGAECYIDVVESVQVVFVAAALALAAAAAVSVSVAFALADSGFVAVVFAD